MITVEPAVPRQARQIYKIEKECFGPDLRLPWTGFTALIREKVFFVAKDGDRIVGFLLSWKKGKYGHIVHLGVTADARGQGVGWKLLKSAESFWLGVPATDGMTLNVTVDNPAQTMYFKFGFRVYAYRPDGFLKMRKRI